MKQKRSIVFKSIESNVSKVVGIDLCSRLYIIILDLDVGKPFIYIDP